jgi:hypothetical protein
MSYNFVDDPTPTLPSFINGTGDLEMTDGDDQGDWLTSGFQGSTVACTVTPPSGWTLDSVSWDSGASNGTFTIPSLGNEDTHTFDVQVSLRGDTKETSGVIKIKNAGGTSGPP